MKYAPTFSRLAIAALLSLTLGACTSGHLSGSQSQAIVDRIVEHQIPHRWLLWSYNNNGQLTNRWTKWSGKQEFTEYLRKDFDVSAILTVLPKLSVQPGQTLDYVYYKDKYGGWPVLYARNEGAAPFESYASLSNSMPGAEAKGLITNMWSKGFGYYLDSIHTDGSQEGYFQLIVLYLMGDQFFGLWHDGYHDELIVCHKSGLDALFKKDDANVNQGHMDKLMPDEIRHSACKLQLAPTVRIKDDTVLVAVTIFTKWGGFQRRTYAMRRYPPHSIIDQKIDVLIKYECGILI